MSEFVAISQKTYVTLPEPNVSVYGSDNCATSVWGLGRIDSVDISFNNEYELESDFPDGGAGANVYMFDTGINVNNGDFGGRAVNRYSCLSLRAEVGSCADNDAHGHGTHVAGTVAGHQYGVAKHATIHGMQVISSDGRGTIIGVLNAMDEVVPSVERYIFQRSIASSAGTMRDTVVNTATNDYDAIVVVAVGNYQSDGCSYSPGRAATLFKVGSHDLDDGISFVSNFGSCIDAYASTGEYSDEVVKEAEAAAVEGETVDFPEVDADRKDEATLCDVVAEEVLVLVVRAINEDPAVSSDGLAAQRSRRCCVACVETLVQQARALIMTGTHGHVFLELCCASDSELAAAVVEQSVAILVTSSEDLQLASTRCALHRLLRICKAYDVVVDIWVSIPCTVGTLFGWINETYKLVVAAIGLCRHDVRIGGGFCREWTNDKFLDLAIVRNFFAK